MIPIQRLQTIAITMPTITRIPPKPMPPNEPLSRANLQPSLSLLVHLHWQLELPLSRGPKQRLVGSSVSQRSAVNVATCHT